MKIFNNSTNPLWAGKVNFVDDNNVVLGYDDGQSCCEVVGYCIADKVIEDKSNLTQDSVIEDYEGYQFDTSFFEDYGEVVVFRIIKDEKEKFIHLFNYHNGYYAHGFDFKVNEKIVQSGSI